MRQLHSRVDDFRRPRRRFACGAHAGACPPERRRRTEEELEALGTVSQRATVGHGSRRLFGQRGCVAVLSLRTGGFANLSLGRGRVAGHHRSPVPPLLCDRALEWPGSAAQGTTFWRRERRGSAWGGREGSVLV